MKIKISLDTRDPSDLFALQALVNTLAGRTERVEIVPYNIDHGSGPLKEVDPKKVVVWTSEGNEKLAKEMVNFEDDVEEAELKTIPKKKPEPEEAVAAVEALEQDQETARNAKKIVESVNPVEAALKQLDPPPPEPEKVDHAVAIRKLMVEVVKVHGPKGAKIASQVVNKIAGVKDVTKIPPEKFEAVSEGLQAAIDSNNEPAEEPEPPSTQAVDSKPDAEPDPSPDDVNF